MKPTPELVLNQAFAKVVMEMGPALPAGYGQGTATITGVLLLMVGQEFNRAAEVRAKENAAMRALFADAAKSVPADLATRLRAAAEAKEPDLSVDTLDRANGKLKALLIELQTQAEVAGDRTLEVRILKFLSEAANGRQVFLPAM